MGQAFLSLEKSVSWLSSDPQISWTIVAPGGKPILCLPPPVCRIHLGIHSIALRVYGPGSSKDHVVFIWASANEVPRKFYWFLKVEKPLTAWRGDGGFSPFRQLVIHPVGLIVHRPSGGVGKVLGNFASAFVEVVINLWLWIVGFDGSDGLFEVFSAIEQLPQVIDEISELIVIGIVTESPPSDGMSLDSGIFLVHRGFPGFSLLLIALQGRRMGLRDESVEAIVFEVSFLWNVVECRGRDTAIGFGGFCRTPPMRWVQLSMRREDAEEEDHEETEQGKLSEDDEPGWVIGTITRTVQQRMERFRQKQMKLDELTQPRWEDAADYFRERDKKYCTFELRVLAVIQPQTNDDAPAPPPTTFGELMESLDIVPWILQRPQGTSRPGSSHIRLCSLNPQSKSSIPRGEPAAEPDSSTLLNVKPVQPISSVEPVNFYPGIWSPANYHIDIGLRRRHGDGSCVYGRIDMQTVIFDVQSLWKASCLLILLHVSIFLISVTKLWDMIIRQCMCKGRTHHVKVLESKSHFRIAETYNIFLQVTVMWQSKSNISDEMC